MTVAPEKTASPLLLTVEGMNGSLDVEVPSDVAIDTLITHLIQHPAIARSSDPRSSSQWTLGLKGGQRFEASHSLQNYNVLEGSVLLLQPADQWSNPLPEVEQELVLPDQNKLLVLQNVSSFFKKFRSK